MTTATLKKPRKKAARKKVTRKPKAPAPANRYVAIKGAPINDKQAAIVGAEFDRMDAEGVPLSKRTLLDRARDKRSPLHTLFDWNDTTAAERWRLQQAGNLINAVRIVVDTVPVRSRYSVAVQVTEDTVRRQHVSRDLLTRDEALLEQESGALYRRLLAIVEDAESIGLAKAGAWAAICRAVRDNVPPAARAQRNREAA